MISDSILAPFFFWLGILFMRVFSNLKFSFPHPGVLLFTVLLTGLLITLGSWQLERARYKEQKANLYHQSAEESGVDFLSDPTDAPRYTPVSTAGEFVGAPILLLDNRSLNGRVGFQALAVFQVATVKRRVLVNLGWYPLGYTREDLPTVLIPSGFLTVKGKLDFPPEKVVRLGPDDPPSGDTWVIQAIEIDALSKRLGYALEPYVVLLDPASKFGGNKHWKPVYTVTPAKHRGYAFQWFALAFALVVLFFISNSKKVNSKDD